MEKSADNKLDSLTRSLDEILTQKAHVKVLLDAFRPLLIEKLHFLEIMKEQTTTFPIDLMRFKAGIALIQQTQLFLATDPWKQLATSVTRAISQGFPALTEDMLRLQEQIESDVINCADFFTQQVTEEADLQLMTWAVKCSVSTAAMGLFLQTIERILLSKRASDMKERMTGLSWNKGYCPVCANLPMLAIIREQGQQWLQCSHCNHEWKFPRFTCPACEHQSPENTTFFYIDANPDEKAFVCDHCQKYLLTVNQGDMLQEQSTEALGISLIHLDIILQNKGYNQMAKCEWNNL